MSDFQEENLTEYCCTNGHSPSSRWERFQLLAGAGGRPTPNRRVGNAPGLKSRQVSGHGAPSLHIRARVMLLSLTEPFFL